MNAWREKSWTPSISTSSRNTYHVTRNELGDRKDSLIRGGRDKPAPTTTHYSLKLCLVDNRGWEEDLAR